MMSISKNIKKLRLEHNLSQKEFAKIAGVSDKAVSTWENRCFFVTRCKRK